MKLSFCRSLFTAAIFVIAGPGLSTQAGANGTLPSKMVAKNISVIAVGPYRFHTFHGISNSHIIETPNELRLIDAQMTLSHAKKLKQYIAKLGKPLVQVILSHNHPDHWFGSKVFASSVPIATTRNVMNGLKTGGGRYIKIMKKKLKDNMPDKVIVPSAEIAPGKQKWDGLDVVVEEYEDHDSFYSLAIKIPAYGIFIGQDLLYNKVFLVASDRKRIKNWRKLLERFRDNDATQYKTLLVGHGANGGPSILNQDIKYLDALEATLKKNMSQADTKQAMINMFPDKGGKGMLGISMNNLFKEH